MKARAVLAGLTALFFAIGVRILLQYLGMADAFLLSALAGVLFYILLLLFLLVHGRITDRRYAAFEKEIKSPVFHKTNGNFVLANGKIKNGNVYFCDGGIVCICLDEKPFAVCEILREDIEGYRFDGIRIEILTKDAGVFTVMLPDAEEVILILQDKGWITDRE